MSKESVADGVVFHAGFPNAAEDEKFGSLSLDALVVQHRASTFFWRLDNDIEERGWTKGSVLVVDRALDPRAGGLVVMVVDDDFILCRYQQSGCVRFDGEPIEGQLWGVVTYCIQPVDGVK